MERSDTNGTLPFFGHPDLRGRAYLRICVPTTLNCISSQWLHLCIILPYDSAHAMSTKRGVLISQITRVIRFGSNRAVWEGDLPKSGICLPTMDILTKWSRTTLKKRLTNHKMGKNRREHPIIRDKNTSSYPSLVTEWPRRWRGQQKSQAWEWRLRGQTATHWRNNLSGPGWTHFHVPPDEGAVIRAR